jgi:4-carboxymuconolactone decarboxylase
MNDFTKVWEDMLAQGQKMAQAFNPALESFQTSDFAKMWPTVPKDMMEMFWGNAFNKDGLDAKTRLLAVVAGLTVQGAPVEAVFKTTVRHALEAGASAREIGEVIMTMTMLAGLPAVTRAMELAESVTSETKEDQP